MDDGVIRSLDLWQLGGYNAAASWLIMVWEGIITLGDEVEFIWPMPNTAYLKWLYFFGKYFALTFQTAMFGIQVGYLAKHPISLHACQTFRLIEMIASTMLMLCFDAVLLLRIYALYGFCTWSSAFGTFGVFIEFVSTIIAAVLTIPETLYDSRCTMVRVSKMILIFVVGTFISQAILLWLAYRRREHAVRARSTIACVTIRDGMLVFVCFASFLTIVTIWTIHNSPVTTLLIFYIPVVTFVATCRIILNLQRTRYNSGTQQFTTEIWGLYESADSFLLSDGPFQRHEAY